MTISEVFQRPFLEVNTFGTAPFFSASVELASSLQICGVAISEPAFLFLDVVFLSVVVCRFKKFRPLLVVIVEGVSHGILFFE